MKKKNHKLALTSITLGWTAIFCAFFGGGLSVLAVPLGLSAVLTGFGAMAAVWRARAERGGMGMAVWSVLLGIMAIPLAIASLSNNRPANRWRETQERERRVQQLIAEAPAPNHAVTNFTSNLPIIILETRGQPISKERRRVARGRFFDTRNGRASIQNEPDHEGLTTINTRGHSSLDLPKKSFTLHTLDSRTNQVKVSLLGLPAEEDWVLYGSFEDKTLMRDVLAYHLTRQMGRYAPRTRYVELFLQSSENGLTMQDYAGVYVLIEKIKRGPQRVNVAKLEREHRSEPEITGGYIVKRDHQDRPESRFHTSRGGPYFYVYPNERSITAEQKAWLAGYFNAFEEALYGDDFRDPDTGYAAYLDVASFIDIHWLVEMTRNVDGLRYSAFLTKDRGGKLKPEPPWDWNRSFGNANYYDGWKTDGWYSSRLRTSEISWFQRLKQDPAFMRQCAARWAELRQTVFEPQNIHRTIDETAALLQEAQRRNFQAWPVMGQPVTCNYFVGQSYEEEVAWLKKWIENRIAWIDRQMGLPPASRKPGPSAKL